MVIRGARDGRVGGRAKVRRVVYRAGMVGDAACPLDLALPNLASHVVEGYRDAPETVVAEIFDGELFLTTWGGCCLRRSAATP